MAYEQALEAAGANVLAFQQFGSYQGDWLAFVEYNGQRGIVAGSYGSCSGCDAFEAEFSAGAPYESNGHYYDENCNEVTAEEYAAAQASYQSHLADFGANYLAGGLYNREHYATLAATLKDDDWFDGERKELCEWALACAW